MATSNRDRIGHMFTLLAPSLETYVSFTLEPELTAGRPWTDVIRAVEGNNGKQIHAGDPAELLKLVSQNYTGRFRKGWFPFRGTLSRTHEAYAGELLQVRNEWAHMKSFTDDDTYRALDTAERLLTAIGAGEVAAEVGSIRLNLRRVTADKDDKKTLRSATTKSESDGLRPWRDVLPPHNDVATGNFQASEFAADLYKVATGSKEQSRDYSDPVEFFRRTYLTGGLRELIDRSVRRLSGDDNASPVINLQTNFGGGKTHSMLSLWHLAGGRPLGDFPQELQELLNASGYDQLPASGVRRVAIVGNHFASTGEDHDGIHVNTIWGELAWQLGGAEGYAIVADADRSSTPPGGALHALLKKYAPAVILIDEWVAYARTLVDREGLPGGTFDDQFTFAQSLTEAAKGTSGVLLAISIPASHVGDDHAPVDGNAEEVGGSHGLEALRRLQNVVRRVADQWQPASSDEAFHIVRQRLFVSPDGTALASIRDTARRFGEYYRKYHDDFPREARDTDYERKIELTYPIHPELFERLYEDWSSLERFQRTRGVLRLMNAVIHALWKGEDQTPLIMPGSIPLAAPSVNSELTQYLQDSWKAVIDADVDGQNSEPVKIDEEKPLFGQRSLTKRLARTVFFGAAPTIGSAQKGLETQRVFLGTAVPGDVPGNFHSALTALADRATYFYSGSGKYWYDLQANISRRAKDQAERLHPEDVWAEITRRLGEQQHHRGDFAGVHVCPEDAADIPDQDEARLVILHPRWTYSRKNAESNGLEIARRSTEHRGSANRVNRNMLVFLAADTDRLAELDSAVRDYLGWTDVLDKAGTELDLTDNQRKQASDKQRQADGTVRDRLLGTYLWALVPSAPDPAAPFVVTATKADGQGSWLAERVSKRLGNDGALNTRQSAMNIRLQLNALPALWADGHVSVGDLWRTYSAYPYMPRLKDQAVLNAGLVDQPMLWQQDGFAIAEAWDPTADRYRGLWIPTDGGSPRVDDSMVVVDPTRAMAQRQSESATADAAGSTSDGAAEPAVASPLGTGKAAGGVTVPGEPAKALITRYWASKDLDSAQYTLGFKKLADEVLSHLSSTPGVKLTVRVDIEATTPTGFDEARVRTISENATQLRFEQSDFEES